MDEYIPAQWRRRDSSQVQVRLVRISICVMREWTAASLRMLSEQHLCRGLYAADGFKKYVQELEAFASDFSTYSDFPSMPEESSVHKTEKKKGNAKSDDAGVIGQAAAQRKYAFQLHHADCWCTKANHARVGSPVHAMEHRTCTEEMRQVGIPVTCWSLQNTEPC